MVSPAEARSTLTRVGWLSMQPEPFQSEVLRRSKLMHFAAGDVIYRCGDPLGGVYGLISGAVSVTMAPPIAAPRLFHLGTPGSWIGEGCFLSRQPRRVGLQATVETWMMYLPLEAMDQIANDDPAAVIRRFVQILLINLDILVHAFYDLQNSGEDRRIASALARFTAAEGDPIPLSQSELAIMTGTSRKQVNASLKKFAALGWLKKGYRSVTIMNLKRLRQFGESFPD